MRVATRRLRSALQTFERLVDPAVVRPLRDELKWLAAELGTARDAEVLRARVGTAVAAALPGTETGTGAGAVGAELDAAYRAAHDRVLTALDGDRYRALLTGLVALVERPPFRGRGRRSAGKVLPPLVARSYARVERLVGRAGELAPGGERDELLHEARKAAKRARYAGEAVAPTFGTDATAFAAALEGVQEALGEHQDSIVARERLRDLALHASSTEVAFLYGRLHAQEEARAGATGQRFDDAWRAARRPKLHRWLR
jgi:CHAD domain-containing protein